MNAVQNWMHLNLEKYSSGWRGAPAKGVDRSRGARVQIPPSPYFFLNKQKKKKIQKVEKNWKKLLTTAKNSDKINTRWVSYERTSKKLLKKVKKVLDKQNKAWYNKEVAAEMAT